MKAIALLPLLLLSACSRKPDPKPAITTTNQQSLADLLDETDRSVGRYQLISAHTIEGANQLFKLDTRNGRTWLYNSILVSNPHVSGPIRASGWYSISNNLEESIGYWMRWDPRP
jgi:hypothetical protein